MKPARAAPLGEVDLRALDLLVRLRLAPAEVLAVLGGLGGRTAAHARLGALRRAGLLGAAALPCRPGPSPALLYLTGAGVATVAACRGEAAVPFAARHGLRASDLRALLPGLPHLLACQALLALLAASRPGTARLLAWERPWRRAYARAGGDEIGTVVFPAGAELAWPDECGAYLLLPEGSPAAAYRGALGGLLRRRAVGVPVPPLLIVAARPHPADAWHRLLEEVARAAGEAPLQGWIAAPDELPCLRDLGAGRGAGGPTQLVLPLGAGGRRPAIGEPFRP